MNDEADSLAVNFEIMKVLNFKTFKIFHVLII